MCNFSGMIKNVLPSLRQRAGPQRICSRQKSIRSGTARNSFSQTPHMRGKGSTTTAWTLSARITPAYAGKSCSYNSRTTASGDHPRMCGEKCSAAVASVCTAGSPPHVRGKEVLPSGQSAGARITPAYAGKRSSPRVALNSKRDHPRMCGEKPQGFAPELRRWGSPPHMRGKGIGKALGSIQSRITPAHAGKRGNLWGLLFSSQDHPRTCGEKCISRVR